MNPKDKLVSDYNSLEWKPDGRGNITADAALLGDIDSLSRKTVIHLGIALGVSRVGSTEITFFKGDLPELVHQGVTKFPGSERLRSIPRVER